MITEGTKEHILLTYKTYCDNMLADEYCHGRFDACVFYFEQLAIILSVMVDKEKAIPQQVSNWYQENISRYT